MEVSYMLKVSFEKINNLFKVDETAIFYKIWTERQVTTATVFFACCNVIEDVNWF